jgi:glycosyltransferase involved in cell wall biosynthesis
MKAAAIVHDFFVAEGGAERCAIELARLLPSASVYTTFFDVQRFGSRLDPGRVHTWPLQRLFGTYPGFRSLYPLYAAWFDMLHIPASRLVLSSSVAFGKAVRVPDGALHVSYVYTPMRYAWDLRTYLAGSSYSPLARIGSQAISPAMRWWDRRTANRPDLVVAISHAVRERIERSWKREVDAVIYPPVDVDEIPVSTTDDGYFLVAARLLAYRRIDLAVRACTRLGLPLVVVGDGPELRRLKEISGQSVTFLGHVERPVLLDLFGRCHAYLLPGAEDFGIAPVEAMAAGKPVVAFGQAGALETVKPGVTGVHFPRPTVEHLVDAIRELDTISFDRAAIRSHAESFDVRLFRARWRELLTERGMGELLARSERPEGDRTP